MKFRTKVGIVLIIVGIMLWVAESDKMAMAKQEPVDIYEENITEIKSGMAVDTNLYAALDYCAYEETTHTLRFREIATTIDHYYYIIPVFINNDTYYMGVEVSTQDMNDYERLVEETWLYLDGRRSSIGNYSFGFQGGIDEVDSQIHSYMIDWFVDTGYETNRAWLEEHVLPYVLIKFNHERTSQIIYAVFALISVGVISLVSSFRSSDYYFENKPAQSASVSRVPIRNNKTKLVRKTIEINGVEYPIEKFAMADVYMKQGIKGRAMEIIRDTAGITLAEAKAIADNWNEYYF